MKIDVFSEGAYLGSLSFQAVKEPMPSVSYANLLNQRAQTPIKLRMVIKEQGV